MGLESFRNSVNFTVDKDNSQHGSIEININEKKNDEYQEIVRADGYESEIFSESSEKVSKQEVSDEDIDYQQELQQTSRNTKESNLIVDSQEILNSVIDSEVHGVKTVPQPYYGKTIIEIIRILRTSFITSYFY